MLKLKPIMLFAFACSLMLCGCEEETPAAAIPEGDAREPEAVAEAVKEIKTLEAAPAEAKDAQVAALAQGNNAFAWEMFARICDPEKPVFFSPFSISTAMAMLTLGAKGETLGELKETMCYPDKGELLGLEFQGLNAKIASQNEFFTMTSANSLWLNRNFELLETYRNALKRCFSGEASVLDFSKNKEAASTINKWVSDNTRGMIKDLISPEALDAMTRLVLVNAVSFLGKWETEFDEDGTRKQTFQDYKGRAAKQEMMRLEANVITAEKDGVVAVELPYLGDKFSLIALMPEDGSKFAAWEKTLNQDLVKSICSELKRENIVLYFPKFETETSLQLVPEFQNLGLKLAFTGSADFTGISIKEGLCVSDIIHKAKIKVYETGTEAAAATAVMVKCTGMNMKRPREVRFNKPFVYLIQEKTTGSILFLGHFTVIGK
ncbi:serpin family protein [bacterium]|nr:serpin family protein [bacterium]